MNDFLRNRVLNNFWRTSTNTAVDTAVNNDSGAENVESVVQGNEQTRPLDRVTQNLTVMMEDPNTYEFTDTIRDMMIQMVFYGLSERYVECYSKFVRKFIEYSLLLQVCF